MIVHVYRHHKDPYDWLGANDATNGGVTNHKNGVHQLTLVNVDGPFDPTPRGQLPGLCLATWKAARRSCRTTSTPTRPGPCLAVTTLPRATTVSALLSKRLSAARSTAPCLSMTVSNTEED